MSPKGRFEGEYRSAQHQRSPVSKRVIMLAVLVGSLGIDAHAAGWRMDPAGSELRFTASFERSPAPGLFRKFDVSVESFPANLARSRIDVVIAVPSADMNSDEINGAIRGPDWFDAGRFPVAEFHATDVRSAGKNRYLAVGTLKVKDIVRPIEVPFRWESHGDAATMDGELTIDRAAFAIGVGEWLSTKVIGADVHVHFVVRLHKEG